MPATRTTKRSTTRQLNSVGKPAPATSSSNQGSAKSKISKKPVLDRVYTNAILSIKPEYIDLIVARKKNHEYRAYKMREAVVRIWLYTTAPKSSITHVMLTTLPKTPGQVGDTTGVGNDDFDAGLTKYKFGYPIRGLYELKIPMKLDAMKGYNILPPQGLVYMPKKLVDDFPLEEMKKLF